MARVSRCLSGWSAASSGLMTPRRTCSAGHRVLVLLALETRIGRRCGPHPHALRLYDREADCVLTDRYAVAVVQLFLLDGLAVHQGAVGAAEVDDPELLAPPLDTRVMAAGRGIAEDQIVVG